MSTIEYEPTAAGRRFFVELEGARTRVVVPMIGPYVPVPTWARELDIFSLVVAPLVWLIVWVVRTVRRLPTPPRATLEVERDRLRIVVRDPSTGDVAHYNWPCAAIVELRANRFEGGLWAHVTGHGMHTLLDELPRESIERIAATLAEAMKPARAT